MIILTGPIRLTLRSSVFVGAIIIGAYVIFGGSSENRKRKKKKNYVPGLANVGNSCFMNAMVQSLASCPLFVSWLESKQQDISPPLVSALHHLLQVLNNEGCHKGNGCAGEVMRALRGHGWVISSEEQDAHELFHALTSTIDEELVTAESLPSLLDVSWMERNNAVDNKDIGDCGLLFRYDFWIRSVSDNEQTITETYKILGRALAVEEKHEVALGKTGLYCKDFGRPNSQYKPNILRDSEQFRNSLENYCKSSQQSMGMNTSNGVSCPSELSVKNYESKDMPLSIDNDTSIEVRDTTVNGSIQHCEVSHCYAEEEVQRSELNLKSEVLCLEKENSMKKRFPLKICNSHSLKETRKKNYDKVSNVKTLDCKQRPQDNPFQGYLASQLQCTLCGYKNPAQWTSFESLSLSLPTLLWREVTLQEMLNSYITQEKVSDVTCDFCTKRAGTNIKTSFTKKLTIGKLPNCLCFHIKRTVWMDNGSVVKRQDHVSFPEFLAMDPYTYVTSVNNEELRSGLLGGRESNISHIATEHVEEPHYLQPTSVLASNATSTEIASSSFFRVTRVQCEQLYRLKAVIVHVGDVFCGHFVTYRRGALGTPSRNRWFYTSDLNVRESNLEEVLKGNAYMILYEKVL